MTIDLHIAGYVIRLQEGTDRPYLSWPLTPFDSFIADSSEKADIHLNVTLTEHLPDLPTDSLQFDACHGLWKLYRSKRGLVLDSADTQHSGLRSRSLLSHDFSQVQVWTRAQKRDGVQGWSPMQIINPVVEICLVSKLAREGGVLLHSSGVLAADHGWLFTGSSGAGKSTLCGFFDARRDTILSDERIFIRKVNDRFTISGTPWVGSGRYATNESGHLTSIYCIRHGGLQHQIEPMPSRMSFQSLLRQCYLPHWDREALATTLVFLSELIRQIPCLDLAFLNAPDIVDYIYNRSQLPAPTAA